MKPYSVKYLVRSKTLSGQKPCPVKNLVQSEYLNRLKSCWKRLETEKDHPLISTVF